LCDSGCDVNLFPVHFVNLEDVLPSDCKLSAAGGTPIEVIGHCKGLIKLENGFLIETDFIISTSIKEPMLGIEWLTRNAVRWNFLEGTLVIQNPKATLKTTHSSSTESGKELAVGSIYAQRNNCVRLTADHVVFPSFTCAIPKEVLFQVLDKLCNTGKTNVVIRQMFNEFVWKLIAGNYSIQSKGEDPDFASEQSDFVRLVLTHDMVTSGKHKKDDCKSKVIPFDQGDLTPKLVELDGLNLPTLFGEFEDHTNY